MDPEEMARLLRAAQAASRQGAPMERINAEIESRTGGDFSDVESLAAAAADSGVTMDQLASPPETQPQQGETEDPGFLGEASNVAESFGHSASFGLTDEIGGLLRGAVTGLVPGGQGFREGFEEGVQRARGSLEEAQEETPIGTAVGGVAGAVAGPGSIGGRFAMRGGGLLARSLRGAGAGAVEGAAFEAGTAEGGFQARSEAALEGAKIGGGIGAVAPGAASVAGRGVRAAGRGARRAANKVGDVLGLTRVGRNTRKAEARVGRRVADEARDVSGVEGSPASVRADIDESRRAIFGPLDEIDEIDHPGLQQRLQSDEIAPFVPEEVAQGARAPSFPEAHGSLRQLRRAKDAALRSGDAASFRELANAERKLAGDLADAVDGFEDASQRYAGEMARSRALDEGAARIKNTHTAESFEEAFDALETEAERAAFKQSALAEYLADLEDVTGIKSRLEKLQHGKRTRRKMEILMGGEDGLAQLEDAAREAERIRNRAKATRRLRRRLVELFAAGAGAGSVIEFFRE